LRAITSLARLDRLPDFRVWRAVTCRRHIRGIRTQRRALVAGGLGVVLYLGAVDGGWAEPKPAPPAARPAPPVQTGVASYFGEALTGRRTASGETVKAGGMTAASRTLPLGTTAKVTNTETGKSAKVTVNDRGPFVKGRIIDVSPKAADHLDMKEDGVARVKVRPLTTPRK